MQRKKHLNGRADGLGGEKMQTLSRTVRFEKGLQLFSWD